MWDYVWCVVTETSRRDRNKLDFAGGGDAKMKLCWSSETIFRVISSMKHVSYFLFCICIGKGLLSPQRYHVITTVPGDWMRSIHWLKCSLLVVELVKTSNMPQSTDRPLELGRSFYYVAFMLMIFNVQLKKAQVTNIWRHNLQDRKKYKWTRYALACCITHHPVFLAASLSICLPLSLLSPTVLALSFSVDKLSESLTTQPGKIARSHAAKQAYPWPWFPLTTFPSAAK